MVHRPGPRRGLDLRRRLVVVAGFGVAMAVVFGGLALAGSARTLAAHEQVDRLESVRAAELSIDELSESLRGDVLAHVAGIAAAPRTAHTEDLDAIRREAALLPGSAQGSGVSQDSLATVAGAALDLAEETEALLSTPASSVTGADLARFDAASARLEALVDRHRTELDASAAAAEVAAEGRRQHLTWFLVAVAVVGLGCVGAATWWVANRTVRSLERLGRVARSVADGDLTARVSSDEASEIGDLARVFDDMAEELENAFLRLAQERAHQEFQARLDRAFEHLDSEDDLSAVLARAMSVVHPSLPMELLVADSSESHVARMTVSESAGAACCPVDSPWACPAVRTGRTLVHTSSEDLDACPRLRGRPDGPHSGVCVPVAFMGRSLGVLHAASPSERTPPDAVVENMRVLAERTGSRLGTLRAFARAERQASTDALTGLENRRSFEDRLRGLTASGRGYALLLADLDRFKQLNDTYGHETGDRALRLFADVLRATLRSGDVVARYGGEEFVVAIPDRDVEAGLQAAERLRAALAEAVLGPDVPTFTVSVGISDSTLGPTLAAQLRVADAALLTAKREGRDRCIVGTEGAGSVREGEPILPPEQRRSEDDPAAVG
ncbi:diguanylate cyclase [Kineosporia sp. R_H_3]|uniref:diguanylate cyclase n=1 Tax=Kineosporia sp. R_H_3 TaxID=1961848 RepID=UPI000B4A801E|nr:diguanylate cyclase [Kineosporia sp. R_H_3]